MPPTAPTVVDGFLAGAGHRPHAVTHARAFGNNVEDGAWWNRRYCRPRRGNHDGTAAGIYEIHVVAGPIRREVQSAAYHIGTRGRIDLA